MAGLGNDELRKLFELYEERLINLDANYLSKFIEMKKKDIWIWGVI